ncbi:MAG: hypothetical protein ABF645_06870, partial [Lentilactobacillus hilgardii]
LLKDNISVSNLIKLMISDVSAILTTSYDLFQVAFILTSIKSNRNVICWKPPLPTQLRIIPQLTIIIALLI